MRNILSCDLTLGTAAIFVDLPLLVFELVKQFFLYCLFSMKTSPELLGGILKKCLLSASK